MKEKISTAEAVRPAKASASRKLYIDLARAMAILMIVMAHVLRRGAAADYLSSTGVAMFFFLSGLVYHWKEDRRAYWIGRLRHLYVPYLGVGLVSILLYHFLGSYAQQTLDVKDSSTAILPNILALFYANSKDHSMKWNETLWFIPCFLVVLLLVNALERLLRTLAERRASAANGPEDQGGEKWQDRRRTSAADGPEDQGGQEQQLLPPDMLRLAACILSLLAHFLVSRRLHLHLPWQAESALAMFPMYEVGIMAAGAAGSLRAHRSGRGAGRAACAALILASLLLTPLNGQISIRGDKYPHVLLSMVILLAGALGYTLLGLVLSHSAGRAWRGFSVLGRRSLDIMLWNKFPVLFLQLIVPHVLPGFAGVFLEQSTLPAVLIAIPLALFCALLCLLWSSILDMAGRKIWLLFS